MLYLLFQLGHDRYALPARDVVEVLPYLALHPIPRAAPGVAGLCNYRGRPVPVLDLCALLCDRPARAVLSTRIIIVKAGEPSAPESGCGPLPPPPHSPAGLKPGEEAGREGGEGAARLLGLIAERATGTLRRDPGDLVGKIPTRMADGGGRSALAGENSGWQIEDGTRPSSREVSPSPPTPPSPAGPTGGEGGRTVGGEGHSRRHPPSSPGALLPSPLPDWPVLLDERGVIQILHADQLLSVTDRAQLNVLVRPSPPSTPLTQRALREGGGMEGGEGEPLMSQLGHESP